MKPAIWTASMSITLISTRHCLRAVPELEQGFCTVTTHASITAMPFFARRGYRILRRQEVERHGVLLANYVMERSCIQGSSKDSRV